MNEMKPEDVMPEGAIVEALELRAPHDAVCRYTLALLREKDAHIKMLDEDRMGWADEAVKAQMKINEKDALIADYIRQIADMQAEIATKDRELTALMKCKHIESEKDAEERI